MSTLVSKRLSGNTILITGASSGRGRSTAFEFARTCPQDLRLILTARRLDILKEIAGQINKEVGEGVKILTLKLDVSDSEEVRGFVGKLGEEWRGIDVLVNNAEEDINVVLDTNVKGLINMTQAILPIFKSRGEGGKGDIFNIGSIAGREHYVGGSISCSSKAAVRSFTDALRRELIASKIRIMEVDPGQVETVADAVYTEFEPLTPDDIAEVVVFAAGRRENVVIADTLVFPNQQAGTGAAMYKRPQ